MTIKLAPGINDMRMRLAMSGQVMSERSADPERNSGLDSLNMVLKVGQLSAPKPFPAYRFPTGAAQSTFLLPRREIIYLGSEVECGKSVATDSHSATYTPTNGGGVGCRVKLGWKPEVPGLKELEDAGSAWVAPKATCVLEPFHSHSLRILNRGPINIPIFLV